MYIRSFSVKLSKAEAEKIAETKGGLLWRAVFSNNKLSEIRQHFIEFKLITFEAIHRPTPFEKIFSKKTEIKRQTITLLANGSTGSVSWVDSMPEIISLKNIDSNIVQPSDRDDEYMINRGRRLATKVMHRHIGGVPEFQVLKIESVYRQYWIAFYGEAIEGKKVRYKPIAADGCGSHRSR